MTLYAPKKQFETQTLCSAQCTWSFTLFCVRNVALLVSVTTKSMHWHVCLPWMFVCLQSCMVCRLQLNG